MEKLKLKQIEEYVIGLFGRLGKNRLLAKDVFDSTSEYANADIVRAFEDMEKKMRLLVRYTKDGNDWVHLTPEGAEYAGLRYYEAARLHDAMPHPPKSST